MQIDDEDLYKSSLIHYVYENFGRNNRTVKLSASSTYPLGSNNRSTIDTIFDFNEYRWVSEIESNPHFLVEFPLGPFYFQSYVLKWNSYTRFNSMWIVEGLTNSGWKTIDEQNRNDLCGPVTSSVCSYDIKQLFVIKKPCYISKLRFTATGVDSLGQSMFSLTQILLFGQYNIGFTNIAMSRRATLIISLISSFLIIK